MKRAIVLVMIACSINAFAQPVIQNGNNIPNVGFTAPVSMISSNSSDITNGGPNHTWDFSSYTFTSIGSMTAIDPATAPMGSSFPTANYAFTSSGAYSFFRVSPTKMEVQAWSITTPGVGNDFSPDPRTILKFPFNYNDSITDTWQKVGGSPDMVTLYYDSYGTLILPGMTYTNVVRIRENYGVGQDDYIWYILNPLTMVAVFDHNAPMLISIEATPTTGINNHDAAGKSIAVYPNPTEGPLYLSDRANVQLSSVTGQIIAQSENMNTLDLSGDPAGIYFLTLRDKNGQVIQRSKVLKY
ncbi:MAG: T9SS type A sorting domain-containing protein [Bacteroidia bacterium]|nr:T9SS type A sorting domain-containing protein [Bacteroidia bacterium]